jgi:mono/diheme cytochrome c family protein
MATHARDLPERTHPVIWTIGLIVIITILVSWFHHWFGAGFAEGRDHGAFPKPAPAIAEPDHAALIKNVNPDVLSQGETIFQSQCARCHGPNGDLVNASTPPSPPARNYRKDAFKKGSGPYEMYVTVTNGFAGMPPFNNLKPEDRYAVIHYIREAFMKKDNPSQYSKADAIPIPKKGEGGEGAKTPPYKRPVEVPVHPLMAGLAAQAKVERAQVDQWLDRARASAKSDAQQTALVDEVKSLDQLLTSELYRAARDRDQGRLIDLLVKGSAGAFKPRFALTPETQVVALVKNLQMAAGAAEAKPSAKGAK